MHELNVDNLIYFSDNGCGIDKEWILDCLIQEQAGVGLYIVNTIIKSLKGKNRSWKMSLNRSNEITIPFNK